LKDKINQLQDQAEKQELQTHYCETNHQVRRSARKDKRIYIKELTEEAKNAAGQRNIKGLYEITMTLSGKNSNPGHPIKDNLDKNTIPGEEDQKRSDRQSNSTKHSTDQTHAPDIPPPTQLLDINTNAPSKAEITKTIKSHKSGKAASHDGIPPAVLKADIQTSTEMHILHPLLRKILEQERVHVPEDWKRGHLVKLPKKGDLSSCNNWQGIMLLSISSKVLTTIILGQDSPG
jgi:hypothetical protein